MKTLIELSKRIEEHSDNFSNNRKKIEKKKNQSKMKNIITEVKITLCLVAQSCPTLCDPVDHKAHQGSLSLGFSGKRTLECFVMMSSRVSSQPRDRTQASCIAGRFFTD